ncbi:hypothetical protein, partial [Mesorhizobium sp.]|uniref:hypothetical protein n=1 Tax=Mesorhizobium sp. TaxID=1871066 RepID=UPI00122C091D
MAYDVAPKRPRRKTAVSDDLPLPEITADLRQRIGSSPIDEFVLAHGASDVFRELVQNEFDADGSEIGIRFTDSELIITGAGRAISRKGWVRLSVLMGVGEVIGDDSGEIIVPKESSIGSKNLGMRSLFRFGDRIHVRSSGRMALLDLRTFLTGRQIDVGTKGRKGVRIHVPYRETPLRRFAPFTLARESSDLDEIERILFPTLVKLALTGRRTGVRALTIRSERDGRRLQWRQDATPERTEVEGINAVRRSGRLQARDARGARTRQDHEEIEFSRLILIPSVYSSLDFPAYYRSAEQVRIAVSLALKAGKPITDQIGYCYYPLQARQARTGCAVSISAPFQLDAERTRLIESEWNHWLSDQAADLVADLVGSDWFGRFGGVAYEAVLRQGTEELTFADLVLERLKTRSCWPSAEGEQSVASNLVVPTFPALAGHLAAKNYLHPDLAGDEAIAELAVKCCAKRFTVNSLVRMRCGGEQAEGLETKLADGEANYRYKPQPGHSLDPQEQHRTAGALTQLYRRLSPQNRRDLRSTRSTLSATGQLEAAEKLIRVSADMWTACPEPIASRLHPILYDDFSVSRHCRPFELARWIEEAADRAADGSGSEEEREALYRHLQLPDTKLSSRLIGIVRRSPVLRDDRGEWARPDALALLPTLDGRLLGQAVRAPSAEVRKRPELLERLAIRRKIAGEDLVAIAKTIAAQPNLAEPFEELLRRHQALLTPKLVKALAGIAFLRSRTGGIAAPERLHLPTGINISCLADAELLIEDRALYRRLECAARPGSAMLLQVIERARDAGSAPPVAHHLYPALVEALRTERRTQLDLANEPILYVDGDYVTPRATLVAVRPPRCLQEAVPYIRSGGAVAEAYLELGASGLATTHHWLAFFQWIDARASASEGRVSVADSALIRDAYRSLSVIGLPSELAANIRCLLSSKSTLHSLDDLRGGRFVEDDYPELAEALAEAKASIAFADREEQSRIIFRRLGIPCLSEQCGEGRIEVGAAAAAPNWFQAKTGAAELEQLQRPDLARGIAELAYAHQQQNRAFQPARTNLIVRRLGAIDKIAFTDDLRRSYLMGRRVSVAADSAIEEGVLYLRPPRYRSDYDHILALELARLAGATRLADVRALASTILPLLQADRRDPLLSSTIGHPPGELGFRGRRGRTGGGRNGNHPRGDHAYSDGVRTYRAAVTDRAPSACPITVHPAAADGNASAAAGTEAAAFDRPGPT